jgi:hypothetical protein
MRHLPVKLTQLASTHNNVRTTEIIGECYGIPVEGERFVMFSKPLDKTKNLRYLKTSPIQKVKKEGNRYFFTTENSSYLAELSDEEDI